MKMGLADKDVDARVLNSTSFSKMTKEILEKNKTKKGEIQKTKHIYIINV